MIKSTSILLKNFFLKKISIWSLFPALTPYMKPKLNYFEGWNGRNRIEIF